MPTFVDSLNVFVSHFEVGTLCGIYYLFPYQSSSCKGIIKCKKDSYTETEIKEKETY